MAEGQFSEASEGAQLHCEDCLTAGFEQKHGSCVLSLFVPEAKLTFPVAA